MINKKYFKKIAAAGGLPKELPPFSSKKLRSKKYKNIIKNS